MDEATAAGSANPAEMFNFESALECNFDIDQLTADETSHAHSQPYSHGHQSSLTNPEEFVNDVLLLKKSNNNLLSKTTNSMHQSHSTPQSSFVSDHGQDQELIELFEYTRNFNIANEVNNAAVSVSNTSLDMVNDNTAMTCLSNGGNACQSSSSSGVSSASSSPTGDEPNHPLKHYDASAKSKQLDLTVQGHCINKPKWWLDTINANLFVDSHPTTVCATGEANNSDLLRFSPCTRHQHLHEEVDGDECDSSSFFASSSRTSITVSCKSPTIQSSNRQQPIVLEKSATESARSTAQLLPQIEPTNKTSEEEKKEEKKSEFKNLLHVQIQNRNSNSESSVNSASNKLNAIRILKLLSPLNGYKIERKRIYTHQKKLNPIIHKKN